MSELEKKFKEYCKENCVGEYNKLAHDLAEIAEKHYDLYDDLIADKDYAIAELKKQIECEIANNSLTLERLAITEEEYEEEIKELKKQIEDIPTEKKIIKIL